MIRILEIYGYLKTFTCIGIRKTRNTDDSLGSGMKLLLPSWLLGFQYEEIETQFLLCWLFHLTRERAAHPLIPNWTRLSSNLNSLRLISNLSFFQNTHESQPLASGLDVIQIPSLFPIRGFYYDICDCLIPRASVNTSTQCVHLTNPNDKI